MGTKQLNETIARNNHRDKDTGWASGKDSGDSHPPPDSCSEIQGMEGKGHPSVESGKRVIDILHHRFKDIVKRKLKENQERTYLLTSFWAGMLQSFVTSRNFVFSVLGWCFICFPEGFPRCIFKVQWINKILFAVTLSSFKVKTL